MCPDCREPIGQCSCRVAPSTASTPERRTAKLRLETRGRGGKSVTVIEGLPRDPAHLAELAGAIKRALGTGGAVRDGTIELQGDVRSRLRDLLGTRGFAVKG